VAKQGEQTCKPAAADSERQKHCESKTNRVTEIKQDKNKRREKSLIAAVSRLNGTVGIVHSWNRFCGTQHRTGSVAHNIEQVL
jgi:hypothetical protein